MSFQNNVLWKPTPHGLQPVWTFEPCMHAIRTVIRAALDWDPAFTVDVYKRERCSKVYIIQRHDNSSSFLFRVSLGVDPQLKTLSEVATLDFVRRKFKLPVPTVSAFNSRDANPVGFEWILMDHMPGTPLSKQWRSMNWASKETLVKRLAYYSATMFQRQFTSIGSLMPDRRRVRSLSCMQLLERGSRTGRGSEGLIARLLRQLGVGEARATSSDIQRIVSREFFWGDRLSQHVPRGPFQSSRDWLSAHLELLETERIDVLQGTVDECVKNEVEISLRIVRRLKDLLPRFFAGSQPERSVFSYNHVSRDHILVDDYGTLTAILDWECVAALPLWKACMYPACIDSRDREEFPGTHSNAQEDRHYQKHLLEYELTKLRKLFLSEMRRLAPEWVQTFDWSQDQRDFELAVQLCDDGLYLREIAGWLDEVDKPSRLRQRLEDLDSDSDG